MKKLIFISLAIIAFMAVSCTDDYTDPSKLSGTSWKCTDAAGWQDYEYILFKFTSETVVEQWAKMPGTAEEFIARATYKFSGKTLNIYNEDLEVVGTITIDGTTMKYTVPGYTEFSTFIKQ